ncbi:MAG TPA: hypothetical protein VL979_03435 [Solirubrobacteraceae bacterium]|nr:hypothetical protein [Solirubrobacteraceae bacterium]
MSYMPAHDFSPVQAECPPDRPLYLNFESKRAGRAVAESCGYDRLIGGSHLVAVIYSGHVYDPCWDVPSAGGWHGRTVTFVGEEGMSLLGTSVEESEREPEATTDPLVDWFAEQQLAAAASYVGRAAPTTEPGSEGEAILGRRGGLRSRAWRGGGTMRRR